MAIEFAFFDLGNVLVSFDPETACRNLAAAAGIRPDEAHAMIYASGLQHRYEHGEVTGRQYGDTIRELLGTDSASLPDDTILEAISNMFDPIESMVRVVESARKSVGRVGVLSNTCAAHWDWVRRQPWAVAMIDFDVKVLSYEVGSMKPDPVIYEVAEQAAAVPPENIFFIDDREENVLAAKQRGWAAFQCVGGKDAHTLVQTLLG